jgi:tetratricopeptide (TPR) repeat protein
MAAAFALALGTAVSMTWFWQLSKQAQAKAEQAQIHALTATRTSVGRLAGFLDDGTLAAKNAEQLLDDAKQTLEDLAKTEDHPLEVSEIEILLLLNVSDVRVALGKYDEALQRAERAVAITERLLKTYPASSSLKHHLYAALSKMHGRRPPPIRPRRSVSATSHLFSISLAISPRSRRTGKPRWIITARD